MRHRILAALVLGWTGIVLATDGRHAELGALLNGMAAGWLAAMAWDATGKERRP